jgi:transposase
LKKGSAGAAALRLKLSPAPGARWSLTIRLTGQALAAAQGRPRGKSKLDPHRARLIELIDQDSDMSIPELAGALAGATGVQTHPDAIRQFLRKLSFTYKKRHWSRPSDVAQA